MKRTIKLILATLALATLFVTPVFATETNLTSEMNYIDNHVKTVGGQITSYLTTDDGCGKAAKIDHGTHAITVDGQLFNWVFAEEVNYVKYLQGVVVNKQETERIKKGNIAALTDVVKYNAGFQPQLNAAIAEYNAAVLDRAAAEQAIPEAQQAFAVLNASLYEKYVGGVMMNTINDK